MIELFLLLLPVVLLIAHRRLSGRVRLLEQRIDVLTRQLAEAGTPAPQTALETKEAAAETETETETDDPAEATPLVEEAARAAHSEPDEAEGEEPTPVAARETFESRFGARWSVWVGGLALALGGIFLVRYSIDAGLLGPGARLVLASLFGLGLGLAGEVLRRRVLPQITAPSATAADATRRRNDAMIPGALTAAGCVTLIATVYTAYGLYDFIGETTAFALLALVSLGTLALSLLHGQALAGLGLAASLATPALVSSEAPHIDFLFGFLALVWLASTGAARLRRWHRLPVLSNLGLTGWVIAYVLNTDVLDPVPPGLALLVLVAGTAFLWPGRLLDTDAAEGEVTRDPWRRVGRLLARPPAGILLSAGLSVFLGLLTLTGSTGPSTAHPVLMLVAVAGALAGLGAGRRAGALPALFAALIAVTGTGLVALTDAATIPLPELGVPTPLFAAIGPTVAGALVLGAIFTLCGVLFIRRQGERDPDLATLWALLAAAVPVTLATVTFFTHGRLGGDGLYGLYGLAIGAALLWSAERTSRMMARPPLARDLLVLGAFAALTFALHALTRGLTTTLSVAGLGFLFVLLTRHRPWRGLPWAMVAAAVVIGARIAWEPTVVGPDRLGTTPVFNALLAGYGIPAALLAASAWRLRHWPGRRALNAVQGLAALAGLLTASILVRHAMTGGTLDARVPTLGEQSLYTLLLIGLSGILMTLDLKSPSRSFRYGSMLAGVLAALNALFVHIVALNPALTNEDAGTWPLVNLLLPGYLLPAAAYAGLALHARGKRPHAYVTLLALTGAVLGFAWATLSVRWFWQGQHMGLWKGFTAGETYTYSVVWLIIGVGLLALGSRLDARRLRLASAGLVLMAVCKVFLIDMANLEGILRALSFIGLGAVLIGIGLFYQRILARSPGGQPAPPAGDPS